MSKNWTPEEIAFLERWAPSKTYEWMAERIERVSGNKRTENAITVKAGRLLLGDSIPDGYVRPFWLNGAKPTVSFYKRAVADAKREGALRIQTNSKKNKYLVKAEWADAWLKRQEAGICGFTQEQIRDQWLTTKELAKLLRTSHNTLAARLTRRGCFLGVKAHEMPMRRWRDKNTPSHRYFWHPSDAKQLAKAYAEHRAKRPKRNSDNLLRNHKGSTINE